MSRVCHIVLCDGMMDTVSRFLVARGHDVSQCLPITGILQEVVVMNATRRQASTYFDPSHRRGCM